MIDLERVTKNKSKFFTTVFLTVLAALLLSISVGFSALNQNLNIAGEIDYLEYNNNLHDAIINNPQTDEYIEEYTGGGSDSLDPNAPSEPIYYLEGGGDGEALQIMRSNNVLFADHCWKFVRTTSTGGVKLLYNGRAENNQCLKQRTNAIGYEKTTTKYVGSSNSYYYATDYNYDVETRTFSLAGNINAYQWSSSTSENIIGKYSCHSTSATDTCSTINLVSGFSSETYQYIMPISANYRPSQFGLTQYNLDNDTLSGTGYMYGRKYKDEELYVAKTETFANNQTSLFNRYLGGTSYWYSDEIEKDSDTGYWKLVNPFQPQSSSDFPNLIGKYSLRKTNANATSSTAEYIVGTSGNNIYYYWIRGNNPTSTILVGSNLTDLGNGSYKLTNTQNIDMKDWYSNYSNYIGNFICDGENDTCTSMKYIGQGTATTYSYLTTDQKILIAKNRSGVNLQNTTNINKYQLLKSPTTYADYKYTCNTESATCTESTLRMINSILTYGYTYIPSYYYGKRVTWDGTNYQLVDTIGMEDYKDLEKLSTHHYMCLTPGEKQCTEVAFIYRANDNPRYYYIKLSNGTSLDTALNQMLRTNTSDSNIKFAIESWYKKYLLTYDSYIEDTIFCNDRTIQDIGGWSETGDVTQTLKFRGYTNHTDISCPNITDKFCVGNSSAHTNYKVGVLAYPEYFIQSVITEEDNSYQYFWTNTPHSYTTSTLINSLTMAGVGSSTYGVFARIVQGRTTSSSSGNSVRPSISLKPDTEYLSGTGTLEDPYVVDTNP